MKKRVHNLFVLPFVVLILVSVQDLSAQRFRARTGILGWVDDNHYIERTTDKDGNPVIMSVHIRTGKKKIYEYSSPLIDFPI